MLLPNDIKRSILHEMTKGPLAEHLVLNTTKLRDDDGIREEIQCYVDRRQNSERLAMDVDAFVKVKRSRGSGSQGTDVCKNSGKKAHWTRDCSGPGRGAGKGMKGDA